MRAGTGGLVGGALLLTGALGRDLVSCGGVVASASVAVDRAPPEALAGDPVLLDGDWHYHLGDPGGDDADPASWPTMPVPSNWYVEGLDHAGVVWFSRSVDLPENESHHAVTLEGVDYASDVYWDGERVGGHRGYFSPLRVNVPPDGGAHHHVLAVRVDSPRETPAAFSLHKTLIKGILSHHDTRPGGAWSTRGQDANTGGIWGHVRLVEARSAFFDRVRVTTRDTSLDVAHLVITTRLDVLGAEAPKVGYRVLDPAGAVVAVGELHGSPDALLAEVTIPDPHLWWPRELGAPDLYRLELTAQGAAGADVESIRFGIRTVRQDSRHRIVINGHPVFLRGTNYIPSQYFASFPRATLVRDLDLMQAANINAIRVHAHVTLPDFYSLADERGLLVWQDFPLQWGYDDSAEFADDAATQAREMVGTLYNHPSIIFWSGINEAPFSSDWMVWKYPDYDPQQNRRLDVTLRETFASDDPSRPSQGNAHPSEHVWAGWYEGNYHDFARPTPHAIVTEFGAQAVPELSTLRTFLSAKELWPLDKANLEVWEYHNFQLHELRDIARVPVRGSLQELVSNTQRYQARLNQFAAENLRRQKWQPVAGIFQFMFVEHWASMSWGAVDYLRRPKLGYAAMARAYQPVLPIATTVGKLPRLALFVVNDAARPWPRARLVVRVTPDATTSVSASATHLVEVASNEVTEVGLTLPSLGADQTLSLELYAEDGSMLGKNDYEAGYFK
jgi:beta-mannosidase